MSLFGSMEVWCSFIISSQFMLKLSLSSFSFPNNYYQQTTHQLTILLTNPTSKISRNSSHSSMKQTIANECTKVTRTYALHPYNINYWMLPFSNIKPIYDISDLFGVWCVCVLLSDDVLCCRNYICRD